MTALSTSPQTAAASRTRRALGLALLVALASLLAAAPAGAAINPASVLEGPSNQIIEVDGAAMAPDGSGGIVYRKNIGGVPHVFVDQFLDGQWRAPVQADDEDPYGASQPAIAAGDGGRLLVVWVQERNLSPKGIEEYELTGASLQPGAAAFGQQSVIDANVSEPVTGDVSGVDPRLAMAPDGEAYVVYRAILSDCEADRDPFSVSCPPSGTGKLVDVRVARFDFLRWSSLGTINRDTQIAMRSPTAANAPSIGIELQGNAVVAWQEPGIEGVARIWARRLFGTTLGEVLQVSPETIDDQPVSGDAEAPMVADSPFGEARIAFRIQGVRGSAVPVTQMYVNSIPSALGLNAAQLTGAAAIPGAAQAGLGAPSGAIDQKGDFRFAWTQGGTVLDLNGSAGSLGTPEAIGVGSGEALTTINPAGGGTTLWSAAAGGGLPVVDVREDYAHGAYQDAQLAGNTPGPVAGLSLGGDGQGDALIAWTQGEIGRAEVVGAFVQAPPASFLASTPSGWVAAGAASVSWEEAPDAVGGDVAYSVYVDGHPRLQGLHGTSASLAPLHLSSGLHHVQVLARDGSGQQTMSSERELKVDASPPTVHLALIDHREGVRVTVSDPDSGVKASATKVAFGDGTHANGHSSASHRYAKAGSYTITAAVSDKAGNQETVHLRVRVR